MTFNRHTLPNFFKACWRIVRWAFTRPVDLIVPSEVADSRLLSCLSCPRLVADTRQCAECTCFVDVKVMLSTESCPLKRW